MLKYNYFWDTRTSLTVAAIFESFHEVLNQYKKTSARKKVFMGLINNGKFFCGEFHREGGGN